MEVMAFGSFELLFMIAGFGALQSLGRQKFRAGQIAYGIGFLAMLLFSPIAGAYSDTEFYNSLVRILQISNLAWEATFSMTAGMAVWLIMSCIIFLAQTFEVLEKIRKKAKEWFSRFVKRQRKQWVAVTHISLPFNMQKQYCRQNC